ncbi:M28 family metallopeptidase [Algoriphagus sediminis]|uniref:M28 family metallopeptidase n=1 Tax=Algoriphagus sediminis TaxID=3057113 RepID=A0ABT7YHW2_9BACT|nr:M28 family metallopeptidase [Algoriphagus sediminis]MDN3205920.1 M28 family metallopeptidase [Algoriphagus sediminis]
MKELRFFIPILFLLAACGPTEKEPYIFQASDMDKHMEVLASDEFEGRMPFSAGEEKTIQYLEDQFKLFGLEPGNGNSYYQDVPLASVTSIAAPTMTVSSADETITLEGKKDYVIWTQRTEEISFEDAEIVFVGFGIVAPEYGWNDYKNIDVKGKIAMMLVNDPGFGTEDETFFKGNTMTYYGRWTYKYEEAIRQGALGVLIVHNTIPAGYGFNVVQNRWNAEQLYLDDRQEENYKLGFEGWVTLPTANKLFEMAGMNEREMLAKARKADFQAISMNLNASSSLTVDAKYDVSKNVIAKIEGATRPNEYIIYTAHWDHLGIGTPDETGDSIYNGALDNASGTAALLALAKGFSESERPERTLVFLAVTAEEQGLWGSLYYALNPVFPKEQTVANINMDGVNPYGSMKDVSVIGQGQSELEDLLDVELKKVGRYASPDPTPTAGYYFRSDHFSFAKVGIPALYFQNGIDHVEKGKEYGQQKEDEYVQLYYHKPSDAYDPETWDFSGAVDDVQLLYNIGMNLGNSEIWPGWKDGSEFKAIREGYMKK